MVILKIKTGLQIQYVQANGLTNAILAARAEGIPDHLIRSAQLFTGHNANIGDWMDAADRRVGAGFDAPPESPDYREMQEFCADQAHAARRAALGAPGYSNEPAEVCAVLAALSGNRHHDKIAEALDRAYDAVQTVGIEHADALDALDVQAEFGSEPMEIYPPVPAFLSRSL